MITTAPQKAQATKVASSSRFVYVVAAIAALSGLLFGYDTGVISGALLFMREQFHLTPAGEGLVVSSVLFGAAFSCFLSGRLTDYFGRKKVILATALLFGIGSVVTAMAASVDGLIAGRVVLGLAIGIASFAAPLYISEMSSADNRGALVALNQLAITIGILLSYIIDYVFAAGSNWQAMVAVGAIPAVLLAAGLLILPESPRWLVLKNEYDKARCVLARIRSGANNDAELKEIENSISEEKGDWKEFFAPHLRGALVIGLGLGIFQQFTGINTVIYYAPSIYKLAGLTSNSVSILATAGVGLINVLMTIIAVALIDRVGRRPLLIIGNLGMMISLACLSLSFLLHANADILRWIGVGSTFTFVSFFAISLGPIFWIIISEVYPLRIRGFAMSFATAIAWVSNLIVSFTFPVMLAKFGVGATFAGYTLIALASLVFSCVMVPETKGLSLEEIERQERSAKAL
jgi:sugar porter (SP) family MFS transporter